MHPAVFEPTIPEGEGPQTREEFQDTTVGAASGDGNPPTSEVRGPHFSLIEST